MTAVVDQNGEVGDDARVIGLRFKLLDDIPDAEPVTVEFTEASFRWTCPHRVR